ncbi:MAG: radical SAM protein [Lachnospiraceae bacterium]|nr:radical SAM protein [Lachnospiraceae bacterium]
MKYILNPGIALRSWWYVPCAYYIRGEYEAKKLQKGEFDFLSLCDGETDLPENEIAASLKARGFIREARPCERMNDWQRAKFCNNRYFPHASLMLTGKCNYNCLHCFNAADNARLQSEFTLEEAETLFTQMETCGINALTLTGGEPMMHPHFMDVVRSAQRHHIFLNELNTNGSFITQEILDEMKEAGCRPYMKISYDGTGHHDWLRHHSGAEQDALRAIRLCKENGFRVMAQTNVHRRNADVMLPTAKLLDSMGVDAIRIIRTSESPRWAQNAGDSCLAIEEYFDRMTEFCGEYIKTGCKMDVIIWQFLRLYPGSRQYALVGYSEGEYRDSIPVCKGNRGKVAIAANGNVFPCHQMSGIYEKNGDILGNVKRDGLQPLLQGGKYLCEVCTTVKELREKNPACGKCEWFPYCCGGCRAIGLALTGDKMGVDKSKCIFYKKGYPKKIAEALPGYTPLTRIP